MQISEQGNIIATIDGGGGINLWDTKLEKSIKHIPFGTEEGLSGAYCMDISTDGNFLIIGYGAYNSDIRKTYFSVLLYDINKMNIIFNQPVNGEIKRIKFG